MAQYNTGNPVGSTDPKDLYDNAHNFDLGMNDVANPTFVDRLGNTRSTYHGLEEKVEQFLVESAFVDIGDYAPGLVITARNQTFVRAGFSYRYATGTLPYTTTGVWASESSLFTIVGDASLRQDLSAANGASNVGFTQSGAGALSRTVLDKLRDFDSVKDFGGIINGAHTAPTASANTAALQAMLNKQVSINLPKGDIYLGSSKLTVTNAAVSIIGTGINSTRLIFDGDGGFVFTENVDVYHVNLYGFSMLQKAKNIGKAITLNCRGQRTSTIVLSRTMPRLYAQQIYMGGYTNPETDGWNGGFDLPGVMQGSMDNVFFVGTYTGTGDVINSSYAIRLEQDSIYSTAEFNITNSWFFHVDKSIDGGEMEGLNVSFSHGVGVNYLVYASPTGGNNPQTNITNCHASAYINAVYLKNRAQPNLSNNLFYSRAGITTVLVILAGNTSYGKIYGNTFVKTSGTVTAIQIGETGSSDMTSEISIGANTFQGTDVGINITNGAIGTTVQPNAYSGVTTYLTDNGQTTRMLDLNASSTMQTYARRSGGGVQPGFAMKRKKTTAAVAGDALSMEYWLELPNGTEVLAMDTQGLLQEATAGAERFDFVIRMRDAATGNMIERHRIRGDGAPQYSLPFATATPNMTPGNMTIFAVSNTQVRFSLRGSDGVIRNSTLTFS